MNSSRSILRACALGAVAAAATLTQLHAAIPATTGWFAIPNTQLRSVCAADHGFPQVGGNTGCPAITSAWNSAVYDTKRNRMIVWGGGHTDYSGNEIYAINMDTLSVSRLTDPGLPISSDCGESIVNGTQPNSRHTNDGIEYIESVDKMFVFGGSKSPCGFFSAGTWLFDFATNTWSPVNATGASPNGDAGMMTAYDPNTQLIFLHDRSFLYSFDPATGKYTQLAQSTVGGIGWHSAATIDPKRKKFIIAGFDDRIGTGAVYSIDITPGGSYKMTQLSTTGATALANSSFPGLEYDPVSDRIVAWGEDTRNVVYSLNLDTSTWTSQTVSGGPAPAGNGVHGRWRYSKKYGVFVLVNSVDDNVVTFRLSPPGPADTLAPAAPQTLRAQ
jgi:hypothetical protein